MKVSLQQKHMRETNRKYDEFLFTEIAKEDWPAQRMSDSVMPIRVLRNRDFLVQIFQESPGYRISVNRTMINGEREWLDGITWDQLFNIKNMTGFAEFDAVEVYPRKCDFVNVANIRHLWVCKELLPFGWREKKPVDTSSSQE